MFGPSPCTPAKAGVQSGTTRRWLSNALYPGLRRGTRYIHQKSAAFYSPLVIPGLTRDPAFWGSSSFGDQAGPRIKPVLSLSKGPG
ncbi:hypothetical protein FHR22_001815 [Sphingopyxis panaciterrae]|nr:hypothetical protein [Sphingopyxis panaciterrae]